MVGLLPHSPTLSLSISLSLLPCLSVSSVCIHVVFLLTIPFVTPLSMKVGEPYVQGSKLLLPRVFGKGWVGGGGGRP